MGKAFQGSICVILGVTMLMIAWALDALNGRVWIEGSYKNVWLDVPSLPLIFLVFGGIALVVIGIVYYALSIREFMHEIKAAKRS